MSESQFLKFNAAGESMPADSTDHTIVRDAESGKEYLVRLLEPMTHKQTANAAAECDIAGGGWRVASVKENAAAFDYTRFGPVLDPSLFPGTPEYCGVWAAEVDASDPESFAWVANLNNGDIYRAHQYNKFWVRLVRGPVSPGQ